MKDFLKPTTAKIISTLIFAFCVYLIYVYLNLISFGSFGRKLIPPSYDSYVPCVGEYAHGPMPTPDSYGAVIWDEDSIYRSCGVDPQRVKREGMTRDVFKFVLFFTVNYLFACLIVNFNNKANKPKK